jgi:hypothetical protein
MQQRHLHTPAASFIAAIAVVLSACGGNGVAKAIKAGLPEAAKVEEGASKAIHVKDPDTGEEKTLDYVLEGGKWVFEKCDLLEKAKAPRTCAKPDGAPDETGG